MTQIRLAFMSLTLLLSSNAWADLRTFEVPIQYRQEVLEALRGVLVDNPDPNSRAQYGDVELLPTGQILVDAATPTLMQIDAIIKSISERPITATPRVSLRYWAVLGARAAASTTNAVGTPPPAVLNDVLAELERLNGDLAFRVIGTAAVLSESGQRGEIEGMTLSVKQTAYAQGDALNAEIEMDLRGRVPAPPAPEGIDFHIGTLKVRTGLQRGEFVVLGESTLQGSGLDGPVFYIVHWAGDE